MKRRLLSRTMTAALCSLLWAVVVSCGTSDSNPTPHPATVVDCHVGTISPGASGPHCAGVCWKADGCDPNATPCPHGFHSTGPADCANGALCCIIDADASTDAEGGALDAAAVDANADVVVDASDASSDAPNDAANDAPEGG